ncbi:MAG: ABC transporter substrate-binding protein, partial [Clostridia bacterium]|nr:ABC transporter substrate-binding protein [Clostridia bacterium]
LLGALASCGGADNSEKAALRDEFLEKANTVVVNEDSVTFTDASDDGTTEVTIAKNPGKTVNLYASFTTLWYEAGGSVIGCLGGDSAISLYNDYIGRDITQDDGVTTVATSASGKKWDVETILSLQPDLIICSTAMSGYSTIEAPAAAANIPLIAVDYNDFSDYLKWFKVFCNLTGHPELWDSVAMKALDEVVTVLAGCPTENTPTVFSMFSGSDNLQANTSGTVVGGMISAMNAKNIVDSWGDTTGAERLDINLETVYASDPDIIIVQCHAGVDTAKAMVAEAYGDNKVWNELRAVKEGRVFYLEKNLFHNKPNSRFAEAYTTLADILYPEA